MSKILVLCLHHVLLGMELSAYFISVCIRLPWLRVLLRLLFFHSECSPQVIHPFSCFELS